MPLTIDEKHGNEAHIAAVRIKKFEKTIEQSAFNVLLTEADQNEMIRTVTTQDVPDPKLYY